jgi:Cell Wall Hydrolase
MYAYVHLLMAFVVGSLLFAAADARPAHAHATVAHTTVIVCKGCVIVPDPEQCRGCVVVSAPPANVGICRGCTRGRAFALRPKPVQAGPMSARPQAAAARASDHAPPNYRATVYPAPVYPALVYRTAGDRMVAVALRPDRAAGGDRSRRFDPPAGDRLVDVAAVLGFPRSDLDVSFAREHRCLATAIYFEARGEPATGQRAVAQVVLNRVSDRHYPSTVCDVVFQNQERRNRCQFSFACDGRPEGIDDVRAWRRALLIAGEALSGRYFDEAVGAATHYHATSVEPYWSHELLQIAQIGAHVFYRAGPPGQLQVH